MIKPLKKNEIVEVTGARWKDWPTAVSAMATDALSASGSCATLVALVKIYKKTGNDSPEGPAAHIQSGLGGMYIASAAIGCGVIGATVSFSGFVIQSWVDGSEEA